MAVRLEAAYADGWDGHVVNRLTRAEAEARDAAGDPYSVVLLAGGRLWAVLDISWGDGYCQVTGWDERGRQSSCAELRGDGEGGLFLRRSRTWAGVDDAGEFEFPLVAARHSTTYRLAGGRTDVDAPHGDRGTEIKSFTGELPPRLPVPVFGRWHDVLALAGDGSCEIADAAVIGIPVESAARRPWQPPRSMRPDGVDELFADGGERRIGDRSLHLSAREAGLLQLPSGRLVAADPTWLEVDAKPFTVTVPPGRYPVTICLAMFDDDTQHTRASAARLDVRPGHVASWEMALRDGQDLNDLRYGQYFGFGVDAGMACFVDAEASGQLAEAWRDFGGLVDPRYRVVGDGYMVAWSSGWGDDSYPTWVGRDADGEAISFVADMLLFPPSDSSR